MFGFIKDLYEYATLPPRKTQRIRIERVESLPILDQGQFQDLPILDENFYFRFDRSPFSDSAEYAIAALITACAHTGTWRGVDSTSLVDLICKLNPEEDSRAVTALINLCVKGLVKAVIWNDDTYYIPTPELINEALGPENDFTIMRMLAA